MTIWTFNDKLVGSNSPELFSFVLKQFFLIIWFIRLFMKRLSIKLYLNSKTRRKKICASNHVWSRKHLWTYHLNVEWKRKHFITKLDEKTIMFVDILLLKRPIRSKKNKW